MLGFLLRAAAAAMSFFTAGAAAGVLAVVSENPMAEGMVAASVWAMLLLVGVIAAAAFSISASLWVQRRAGR
jgi:uncharacterized membrane protein YphA (DoxX/SURF4 family)